MDSLPPLVYGVGDRQPPNFLTLIVWQTVLGVKAPIPMVFPVMPESMNILKQYLTTVTPAREGGWVDDFGKAPSPIDISGTFGYNSKGFFNGNIYNGFGWVKYLEWMVDISHERLEDGSLPSVWLMSLISQHFFEIELMSFNMAQNINRNTLWTYVLKATILGPVTGNPTIDAILTGLTSAVVDNRNSIAESIGKVRI